MLLLIAAGVLLFELVRDAGAGFRYPPALINLALLAAFAESVLHPPCVAERAARLSVPNLSAEHVRYCRGVTLLWCGFFAANGLAAAYTACCCSLFVWTLYNGLISYVLIGLLCAGELAYRSWRFRIYSGGLFDPVLRRLFPERHEPAAGDENDR